jgi:hypothetical protein
MGKQVFRIKQVPKPRLTAGAISNWNGSLDASKIQGINRLTAYLDGFAFDGVKFKIVSYGVELRRGGGKMTGEGSGPNVSGNVKNILKKARRRDVITFYNIKAVGPNGPVYLDNVSCSVK